MQSSARFLVGGRGARQMWRFVDAAASGSVNVKWFGADEPLGFTRNWTSRRYANLRQDLPQAANVLAGLCDARIAPTLSRDDCRALVAVIARSLQPLQAPARPA